MNQVASTETPLPEIGAPFQGGFFAGIMFQQDGSKYALIVAPKAEGEAPEKLPFTNGVSSETAARSLWDGQANNQSLLDGDHPAAQFCANLKISGFEDWYLPSKDELYLIASRFLPADDGDNWNPAITAFDAFKQGGPEAFGRALYWSSTEASAFTAWCQGFSGGGQLYYLKDFRCRVRAVRKYPL